MKPGRIMSREDATAGDLFDMNAALISQINLLETVLAMMSSVLLADHGHYEAPPPEDLVTTALDCLGDYLNEFERAHRERDAAITFLNSPE
jgi:hypothetical protein